MKTRNKTAILGLTIVVSFTMSLLSANTSFADISAPYSYLSEYSSANNVTKIRVINPDGADLFRVEYDEQGYEERYEFEKHVDYGTILTIGSFSDQNYAHILDENRWLDVKLQDVKPTEPFDFSKAEKKSYEITRYVFNEKGCLYKGPDYLYGRVDDGFCLPKGITISSAYYDDVYMFVEYKGHSGWVAYNSANPSSVDLVLLASKNYNTIYSIEKNYLYKNLDDKEPFYSFEVPELTEIKFKYFVHSSPFDEAFYVEYDGNEGWIKNDVGSSNGYSELALTTSNTTLYANINNPTEAVTIPAFTEMEIKFHTTAGKFTRGYYMTAGDKSGWFLNCTTSPYSDGPCDELASEGDFVYARDEMVLELKNKKIIYTNINGEETGEHFDTGKYKMKYQVQNVGDWYWYYIEDDNHSGWIRVGRTDDSVVLSSTAEPKKETEELLIPESFMNENTNDRDDNRDEDKENIEQSRGDEGNLLIFLIIGFGILSTSIIIALILAKKHKKNKENASDDGGDNLEKSGEKAEENKPSSDKDDEENGLKSIKDEEETDKNFDNISDDFDENREENGNENSEEEEKSSEENESYFEKELKKIEEESEKKSDEIDQNFTEIEEEIESDLEKEQEKSAEKFIENQTEKEKKDE